MKTNGTPYPTDLHGKVHLSVSRAWLKMQQCLNAAVLKKELRDIDKILAEAEERIKIARKLIADSTSTDKEKTDDASEV